MRFTAPGAMVGVRQSGSETAAVDDCKDRAGSRPDAALTATAQENEKPLIDKGFSNGSGCWTRTNDPLINSQLLYQLS
jgi:hypothetical protein